MVAGLGVLALAGCSGSSATAQRVELRRALVVEFTSSASDAHAQVAARCHLTFEYQNRPIEVVYRDPDGARAERAAVACAKRQPEVISVGIGV